MLLGDRVRWPRVETSWPDDDPARAILVAVVRETRTALLGRGDPQAAVALVRERVRACAAAGSPVTVGWMSLPRGAAVDDELLGLLGIEHYSAWDWMATDVTPAPPPGPDAVVRLDPAAEAPEIRACLAAANPGTTADPTGPDQAAWFGVREGPHLVGVFGASVRGGRTDAGFSWHLHGLGVRPGARGRGLGAALTATVTRAGLAAGADWVSLALYADNDRARRIYRGLGYVTEGEFVSFGPHGAARPPT